MCCICILNTKEGAEGLKLLRVIAGCLLLQDLDMSEFFLFVDSRNNKSK